MQKAPSAALGRLRGFGRGERSEGRSGRSVRTGRERSADKSEGAAARAGAAVGAGVGAGKGAGALTQSDPGREAPKPRTIAAPARSCGPIQGHHH